MHEINRKFEEVKKELWSIKRHDAPIDFKDLVDFYKEYEACANFVLDTVNAQVIQYDGFDMPFSQEEISYMIQAFITFNQYHYNRLIVETLFVLDTSQAYEYLNMILDHEESRKMFVKDFQRFSHFQKVKDELLRLGNKI